MTAIDFSGKIHPYIEDLPIFEDKVDEIAESIDEVGLLHPITLDSEGQVIGGRHRLTACEVAGIDPTFEVWEGDALAFMLHDNDARKHQTTGQLAAEKALTLDSAGWRENGRWKRGTVELTEVDNGGSAINGWIHRVKEAGTILDILGREALVEVAQGVTNLDATFRQAKAEKERRERERRAREEFEANQVKNEADAERFFQDKPKAMEWYGEQIEGKYQTWLEAKTGYLAYDKEQAWEEEKARREEEEARRAQRDRIERMGRYLEAFVSNFQTGLDMADHPERDAILDTLTPQKRSEFLNIENTYLKGKPE